MSEIADFDLLQRWRAGDDAAADALTRRHYDRVFRFFEIKAPRVADDLTQRTFLALVEGKAAYRGDGSFKSYVFGIARRTLLRHLRDSSRHDRVVMFGEEDKRDSAPTPSRVVAHRQEQRLLVRALDDLEPEAQITLQLFYWEGLRSREIADVLEVPLSTVTSRLSRARAALRERVQVIPAKDPTRASLMSDLEGWTRSLAGVPAGGGGTQEP